MSASSAIAVAAVLLVLAVAGVLQWRARDHVVTVAFWFHDEVTFELPDAARLGGPLTAAERDTIEAVARAEVEAAFSEFRVAVTDSPDAFYRVRVVQLVTLHRRFPVSGQSNVFGPLGGVGTVSYETLASHAVAHAPSGADRVTVVEGIGRGLGRAAVHELAHQILPQVPIHASRDPQSYEYRNADRPAQYYGPMRWDLAHPHLMERLGR